jgi:DNA-directed RNA polymerase subunit RPC12/RpoP
MVAVRQHRPKAVWGGRTGQRAVEYRLHQLNMDNPNEQSTSGYTTCHCKNCGGGIEFQKDGAGQEINCPHCGKKITLRKQYSRYQILILAASVLLVLGIALIFHIANRKNKNESTGLNSQMGNPPPVATTTRNRPNTSDALTDLIAKANQGSVEAQNRLGEFYAGASGITPNYAEAIKWWSKAAEQSNPDAQYNLGQLYYFGRGMKKDLKEALKWYRSAAEQGNAKAQFYLAFYYGNGMVVENNNIEAAKWCHRSAEQGNPLAEYTLATKYEVGQGVTQDFIEAYKWYSIGLKNGLDKVGVIGQPDGSLTGEATKSLTQLKLKMSVNEIGEAENRARVFIPSSPHPVAPTESRETMLLVDSSGLFEIRINRILIGQRTVDENIFYQNNLDDLHKRGKEIVYFDVALTNMRGLQEQQLWHSAFSLQDTLGNTYSSEQTIDYINGGVLLGKTGRGGISFAVENGSFPETLTYDTGFVYAGTEIKMYAKAKLNKLSIFRHRVGVE